MYVKHRGWLSVAFLGMRQRKTYSKYVYTATGTTTIFFIWFKVYECQIVLWLIFPSNFISRADRTDPLVSISVLGKNCSTHQWDNVHNISSGIYCYIFVLCIFLIYIFVIRYTYFSLNFFLLIFSGDTEAIYVERQTLNVTRM